MKLLFKDVMLADGSTRCVGVEGARITLVTETVPQGAFDRVIEGKGRLLLPGFVNAHTHVVMTIFRGYGEDLPLDRWLNERIFPAEDRLTPTAVRLGSQLAIAEMLAGGVTSFSDMYYFCEETADAVAESGIKANLSRSVVGFDPMADYRKDARVLEAVSLYQNHHGREDGRIRVDLSLHAEYTNCAASTRTVAALAAELGTGLQIHLSETAKEHRECLQRHGRTPTEFFLDHGAFAVPVQCAHAVYLTDSDRAILAEHGASVIHNPVSNLKLGSGVMPLRRTLDASVNVALGTDGAASNNRLDLLREMQLALLLQKGSSGEPDSITAEEGLALLSRNGYLAQAREDCGAIAPGYRADLVLMRLDTLHNLPVVTPAVSVAYSAKSDDVCLTMVDGRILYENGEFTTLDVEKLKDEFASMRAHYFD